MMHKMILVLLGLLGSVGMGVAQLAQFGQCEDINLMNNFVLDSFLGAWYEVGKSSSQNADCSSWVFTSTATGITVTNPSVVNNFVQTVTGTATHTAGTAQLTLTMSSSNTPINFWILDTDYNNYAIAIECVNLGILQRSVNVWQLGRAANSFDTGAILQQANTALATINLSVSDLQSVDHSTSACTQLPIIPNGQPIVLPGPCNTNINVVQNFRVGEFGGTWHEISSYFSENAVGTCARADYTLVGSTMNVVNSQVLNGRLDTITGTATLIGTSGEGRLSVVLDVQGTPVTQELLILDTDYTGYAVSYSCVNLPNNQRRVNSWILSRSRQISAASQTEVDRVIDSYVDLNAAYFQATAQTDDACFYYPVFQPGVPVVFPGQCDMSIPVQANFDPVQYMGLWHDIESYPSTFQQGTCNNAFYTLTPQSTVDVFNTQVVNQRLDTMRGVAVIPDLSQPAKLRVSFPIGNTGETTTTDYWILSTDYNSYSLVYTCENLPNNERMVFSWKLSRTKSLTADANTAINNVIASIPVLDSQYFPTRDQSAAGCFYFPEAVAGQPVVFPGQCDESINAMASFNMASFAGVWHEVEAYPKTQQSGTCVNHEFTSITGNANSLNLVSNQVINQLPTLASGSVSFESTDGSGKLRLIMTVNGQPINFPYWILTTDYSSYALVYSCMNINEDYRSVHSWKLSRTQNLPAAAVGPFNNAIAAVQVLEEEYFEPIDQTEAGCFTYPEIPAGQPVILPGQCDTNINVVQNFQVGDFGGTWHEISSYFSENAVGTCARADYTLVGSTVNVVNSQVLNGRLDTITGTATLIGTSGEGRLSVVLDVQGTPVTQELLILDTDYTGYAVSYSCVNLPNNQRRVNSWILSRSRQISAASQIDVDRVIDSYVDLNAAYFQATAQTDDACFYYPVFQPEVPVVFPGQCDMSIPVQANFDPVQYMGLWHDIESYPSTFQQGTCNNAFYFLTPQSTVDVFNTQVVNQRLDTMRGVAVIPDLSQPAKLRVSFPIGNTGETTTTDYWILSTDYNSYSLVYTCENLPNNERMVFSWKLSRTKSLTADANTAINNVIASIPVLDSQYFPTRDQSAAGCFYFPEAVAGQPVFFPGHCDESINAMASFNMASFAGVWHEVEAYPKTQQSGTCVNHEFTSITGNANSLNLVSNQVVNQLPTSASGSVSFESTDGSGKLRLIMTVNGQPINFPYWILTTDYSSYALVYSCMNINEDYRSVHSWKLSRTQNLPAAAVGPFNNAIAAVQVLEEEYFEPIDQTEAGCFTYPEIPAGQPVILPGQCDTNINVVQNFQVGDFGGTWQEISSYFSENAVGTCARADYTLVGSTVNVVNSQVLNGRLDTITGTATLIGTSGEGRLSVVLDVQGTPVTQELLILDTDYTGYAVSYSCVNLPNNQRRVNSWILSRSRQISAASQIEVDRVIDSYVDLNAAYFQATAQTDDACFYYPVFQPGVPVVFPGQCDMSIPVQANFDPVQYMGLWHDIESYPSTFQQGTCNNAFYTLTPQSTVDVFNTQVVNQRLDTMRGVAVIPDLSQPAKLRVSFPIGNTGETTTTDYWILSTDYNSYSLVYTCENLPNNERMVFSWKLSRTKSLTADANTAINNVIASIPVLDSQYFPTRDQSAAGCFYFPEAVAGQPVVFPGQCDESINAMASFNMASFAGVWHEVEAYPKTQQSGTCVNHEFTPITGNANSLNLVSNQVVNQLPTSASGSVSFESTDGSGKLRLIMTVNGQPINFPYWILTTDYSSYALVYSCMNINNDYRSVHSWKLSRTQNLPAAAVGPFNNAIAAVQVLEEEYFEPIDQTEAGCSTYPEIPAGQPVILPGQCDTNINVVQNFQVGDFGGTWHEISSYFSENAVGTCARADYTLVGSTVNVVNSQVLNGRLDTITGTATLIGTSGEGRLSVVLDVQGTPVTQELLILDTDYTGYAVSYSCVNLPNNQRRVNSWILSRSRQISAASQIEVDRVIDSYVDLNAAYFQATAQTDDACFYYPVFQPGVPVVFPGQCDMSIPVQANFDPVQYMGLWHDIESYPSTFQQGTCNNAFYTLTPQSTVDVFNTQVVNQRLDTMRGVAVIPDLSQPAKLRVSFPIGNTGETTTTDYWILSTDYNSYSLVYTCENLPNNERMVFSWKLSRTKSLTADANTAINNVIASIPVLDSQYFPTRDQSAAGCFYFPEAVAGQPVVFPGQCDESINAMASFNMASFAGVWHEVEAYPKTQQSGTCVNHEFTPITGNANSLNLVSNQVVNQLPTSASGSVSFESTDGSGKLRLIMTVNGQPINFPYWILTTDYSSYALVYSCMNINNDYRSVHSWKLSRTQNLPAAAVGPFNNAIAAVQVLEEEYFEPIDQTEAGCSTYPEIPAGQPVILPGQCDTNINVVQNFQVGDFGGTWHEISSYFSENAVGTCARADYTLVGSTVNVVNSQVLNGRLDTITGTATLIGTSGEGRLSVVLDVQGTPVTQELLILDTDYTGYAVSYSCVNLPNNQRRVNSWILSRSRQISAASQIEVDRVIDSYVDLNAAYFQATAQTDDACFYYPVFQPGVPVVFPGQCDMSIPVQANFDPVQYMGLWHDIESYPSTFQQGTCNNAFYTLTPQSTVDVFNTQVVNQRLDTMRGVAVIPDLSQPAKLRVSFPIGNTGETTTTDYWILSTDYNSYSLVYTCENLPNNERMVFSWKLSRTKSLTADANTAINNVIASIPVLDSQYFPTRDQSAAGCFYFPEAVAGQPVVFPGQCDESINAMASFNMASFAGVWHEVEAYPKTQQSGTCVNHEFTPITGNANSLNLVSNQVVNQLPTSASGSVSFESTDGSGKLRLIMTVNGQPINFPYWILTTDYSSYALVYSCMNINNDYRSVHSWKLSRTQNLPAAAVGPFNNAIAAVQVLEEEYFEPIDQTEAGCSTYPEIPAGQPVILPGQCDTNINVVQNFQVGDFGGTWHEISSYFSENAVGTCARADYTLVGSTVNVVNSQVLNGRLDTITGTATLIGTSGEGRLSVVLDVQGTPVTQELLILDTDYTGYAVSYSCVNLPNNQRRVNSWILSRSRQISAASQIEVDRVIDSYVDLNAAYFQATAQTDDACFYYPVFQPGVPVVFPGQCDMSIPVQANFDPVQYMGLWHDIESYPSTFQQGTCNNAFYTLTPQSTVDVFNTQVVNQRLDTMRGVAVIPDLSQPAKLRVSFPIGNTGETTTTDYWILSTDYNSYSLVYTCENLPNNERMVFSWKLSRTKSLTADANTAINNVIASIPVLDSQYFPTRDQSAAGCFYFPEAVAGQPVVFPGQCDESINAMASFNMASFAGVWHEVEAYPKTQQSGTCVNHEFTPITGNANSLNLVSNQVVNQLPTSASGSVSFESTDGSGKLRLIMTVNGQPINFPYWILTTDYSSYALVYSCMNINNDYRSVHSWKLSRTQNLPAAAVGPFNNAIAAVQVLEEEYFEPIDQTEAGCSTYPEIPAGQPVILPGQCDTNINVVQNFQVGDFGGTWHEISSYFSENAVGTCARADYTLVGSTVNVVNSQVLNGRLDTITGTATLIGTSGEGRLSVVLDVQGTPVTQELLILDTDYTGYAVSYSCVNLPNNQRRVNSWILSRSRQISAASQIEVDRVIDSYVDLNAAYFQATAQTDDACFYYPVFQPGVPVVFPGQCDMSIPVQANFDPVQYMGLWHDIESYPSTFQQGTCNNAFYTLTPQSTVDVFNTQVVNQRLDTMRGVAVIPDLSQPAKLRVSFPIGNTGETTTTDYWILSTDYNSYSLVYTCENLPNNERMVFSWKLSRTKSLTADANTAINNVIASIPVLDSQYFPTRDQSAAGCFYFPEAVAGQPVVFPGQCDESINAMASFNMASFAGVWHEVEAYPKTQQSGTCVNHEFTPITGNANSLNLVSNQVVNQLPTSASGSVSFESTDGSGKLRLIMTVNGQPINFPYWILTTDYSSYALVYSCMNINNDYRSVHSWKLSRTQNLPAAAVGPFNNAIAAVQVLEEEYFEPIDQTEAGCSTYPEIPAGQPVILPGQCDTNINVVQNFQVGDFGGTWHEISSYFSENAVGTCARADYTLVGSTVNVVNSQVLNGRLDTITGTATLIGTSGEGRLSVVLDVQGTPVTQELLILDTDYTGYAVSYSCVNLPNNQRRVNSWILSRSRQISAASQIEVDRVIDSYVDLNAAYFQATAQTDDACFYYPVFQPGVPVVFPGQCDMSIPVQANFDPVQYMGLWHDIESYPSTFQQGTCNNAFYTLTPQSTVDVFNTQVVNQRLDTMRGVAVIPDLSQPAKLRVSFPIGNTGETTTTDYWILSTDYNSYSLVYTCENLPNNERMVFSWKLSRTKSLTADANTAINNVIASIPVLDSQYFPTRDQSAAGCFYFPEAVAGQPVVFPGQCDESINAMASFNMASFAGVWHEVEAYPKTQQSGTCVNHEFTPITGNANSLNLVSNQVVNQLPTSASGSVSFESTDGSGKLRLIMTVNGQPINFPYWILTTDYSSYALVYSCMNINNDYRSVHSWKLSRTQNLPAAAVGPFNNAIAAVQVLEEEYFEPIDQTEAGCSTYPEIPAGQPVILPGQCDTNINVVQNFQVGDFGGTWHEISSYFSENAVGTCARADYTLVGSTVNVVNSQVLNGRLDTITGTATLIGTSGEGRLSVVLDVQGTPVTQELLILDTDYTGYAVSYSCVNLPNNQRRVNSWILSRSRQISAASQIEVDRVIDSYVDLNAAYFQATAQTDDACFYYPVFQPGVPVVFPGQCDMSIPVQANFDPVQYMGLWHDIESYPSTFQQGTCNNAFYTLTPQSTVDVFNTQVVNQRLDTMRGVAVIPDLSQPAKLRVSFPIGNTGETTTTDYWILSTDYNSYSLVYTCENLPNNERMVFSWKLSRTKSLTADANTAINNVIASIPVLDSQYFPTRDQSAAGCFYFPEAVAGQPVVFPGQCDESINAMASFNMASFAGVWHEVEAYPKTQQSGTCVNHEFTPITGNANSLNLVSNQVVNQLPTSASGSVSFESTDGSGKLRLIMTVNGQPINFPYWILTTDYSSYAMVYSCMNINDDYRSVHSWKLSRTQNLPAAAVGPFNNAIAAVQVLEEEYFEPIDQTEAGCFTYPEIPAGQPVILPGQCDTNINVVQNFQVGDFGGTWHEISSYFSENAVGTCARADYTLVGSTVNVVNSQVLNGRLDTISGTATLIGTSGEGRLSVVLDVQGTPVTQELLILDTDYTGYAVSYSCVNLPNNQRRVNSWILSRSRQISAASQIEVDRVIDSYIDLNAAYFQATAQTDDACFYYPVFQPGVPVVFPGQCDMSIPVQANFDPVQYMGLWHDIESYPSTFQQGTCNNAFYTLTPQSTVDVFNTQVVNQRLDTMRGVAVIPDLSQPAKLRVSFPIGNTGETTTTDYWILSTDYNSYSLVYTCENLPNNERMVFSWKLSRTKSLTADANTAINNVIASIPVLDSQYFPTRDQSAAGCFYFPEAVAGQPVVFPGQCDESINAMASFNMASFAGVWHEVEAYPKTQQSGTCVNHEFTSITGNANSLNLVSNQVVNQLATSASGSVSFESTDGSGKLRLIITVNGQSINFPYWILATDYSSYALVYSCMNINEDYRSVHSWKLSRAQTLPAAAVAPINTAIAAVQVLENEYFEPIDQSEDGCFSYPNIPEGDPIILPGECQPVSPVTGFQTNAFGGTWYEAARYASERQTGDCAASQFTTTAQNTFTLTQTIVYNERQTVVSGTATLAGDGSGVLTATLSDGADLSYTATMYILDTDYNSFALLYSCDNIPGTSERQVYSWQLSRLQSGLTQEANERISEVIANTDDLFETFYQPIGQTSNDCFYYPIFEETPEAIVLPGTCPVVSGKANFAVDAYLGIWYDVASFPVKPENITCSRIEYFLVDGVITIRDTVVENGQLITTLRTARRMTEDTGVLQVTLVLENGEEVVTTYYILETDYTSFSLVYSCRNLEDEQREVSSWKLSRTPTLTPEANEIIDEIITNTEGLLEEYYESVSQSDQDCFFVPELVPGQSVLFRGACEPVSGMPGFNPQQYLGWWHEIERYPIDDDDQLGQCTSADFTQTGTAFQVVESSVDDGEYSETTSAAVLSADGTITINRSGGSTVWTVLTTDHDTYSLLYACENVNIAGVAHRRVWSAKHSKSRSLTQAAQNAMLPAITTNTVLHQHLYENVNQSNSACFHYKEDAGERVILEGQCDPNIPVQSEFDVNRFAGTWYQHQRYPYPQVSNEGTCVGTRYTINGDTINVQNWEVLDGNLNTIQGTATANAETATLTVTLPAEGDEDPSVTNLRILTTDYENYALAYTCDTHRTYQRAVGAFILSRSREMTNEEKFAVENYMRDREEFHQPYFITIAQTTDCLEPSSAFLAKSSIIVMLVCIALQLVM